jgi:hypothetical protein
MAPSRVIRRVAAIAVAGGLAPGLVACDGGTFTGEPGDAPADAATRRDGGDAADAVAGDDA